MTAITVTKKIFEFLRLNYRAPSHKDCTEGNTYETVDTSGTLTTNSKVYLDNDKVIDGTLSLGAATSITAAQTSLTEGSDYTVDLDMGEITILAGGTAKVASKSLFARYQYNNLVEDSVVSAIIARRHKWIEGRVSQVFGTSHLVDKEEHQGKGAYKRLYRPFNLPLKQYKSQLTSDIGTALTAIPVDSTDGLSAGDMVSLGEEKLQVSAILSSTAFRATRGYDVTSAVASHSNNDWLTNVVLEISNQNVGFEPTWSQSEYRSDFDVDSSTGAVQLMHVDSEDLGDLSTDVFPPIRIFNRLRITYRYGNTDIPKDIEDLAIRVVARELIDMAMSKALSDGANSFNPNVIENLDKEIRESLREYRLLKTDGF